MRVFISSTCYDLIDIRADIAEYLSELGISVLLSDDKLSDFDVLPDLNSIEVCLANVRSCDELIIILDQRYGPNLSSGGYGDISATHLEYRTAVESNIRIHMFVRDRLDAEARIWRSNKNDAIKLNWVKKRDYGIFDILAEHATLTKERSSNNWRHTFTNSVDMRHSLKRIYANRVTEETILRSLSRNEFPIIHIEISSNFESAGQELILFNNTLQNLGGAPAFALETKWLDQSAEKRDITESRGADRILAPGQTLSCDRLLHRHSFIEWSSQLDVCYLSAVGVRIRESWKISYRFLDRLSLVSGASLLSRTYEREDAPIIELT